MRDGELRVVGRRGGRGRRRVRAHAVLEKEMEEEDEDYCHEQEQNCCKYQLCAYCCNCFRDIGSHYRVKQNKTKQNKMGVREIGRFW